MGNTEVKVHRNTVEEVKAKLRQYLMDMGVQINRDGTMKCPIPDCHHTHGDKRPSARFAAGTDEKKIVCYTNDRSADIFNLVHLQEGLPVGRDPRFYTVTVPTVAERYGVQHNLPEISIAEQEELRVERAYSDAAYVIHANSEDLTDVLLEREWDDTVVARYQIGRLAYATYVQAMISMGWDKEYLIEIGLRDNPDPGVKAWEMMSRLVNSHLLTFPYKNDRGQVVGFVARNLEFNPKEKKQRPKYTNSRNSAIFQKNKLMYNLCRCDPAKPLIIVEGYTDVVTLDYMGITNVAALGATALSKNHANLLSAIGYRDIILCLDNDEGGIKGTNSAIKVMQEEGIFRIQVRRLPKGLDPDAYMHKGTQEAFEIANAKTETHQKSFMDAHTAEEFSALCTQSGFRYLLDREHTRVTTDQINEIYIPQIIEIANPMLRMGMISDLSEQSGIPMDAIREGVDYRLNESQRVVEHERELIEEKLRKSLYKGGGYQAIMGAADQLKKVESGVQQTRPEVAWIQLIDQFMEDAKTPKPDVLGFTFPELKRLQDQMDGIAKEESIVCIAGLSQHGKSTLARNIALYTAFHNPDAQVLFIPIDQSNQKVLIAWAATLTGIPVRELSRFTSFTPTQQAIWTNTFNKIRNKDNLQSVDLGSSRTPQSIENWVRYYSRLYPERKPVVIVDSLHDLETGHDMRGGLAQNIKSLKAMARVYDVPLIFTAHVNKVVADRVVPDKGDSGASNIMWRRCRPRDIHECSNMEYDADVIITIHSDLQLWPETWLHWDHNGIKMPIAEAYIWKNRETGEPTMGWDKSCFFQLNRVTSRLTPITYDALPKRPDDGSQYTVGSAPFNQTESF